MPESDFLRLSLLQAAALAGVSVAGALAPTSPASAQAVLAALPAPTDIQSVRSLDKPAAPGATRTTYCVRLCDGRHFPLPRMAGAVRLTNEQICSAMCPAAETRVFSGPIIDQAIAPNGDAYSSLANAYLYREKLVPACGCAESGSGDVAARRN